MSDICLVIDTPLSRRSRCVASRAFNLSRAELAARALNGLNKSSSIFHSINTAKGWVLTVLSFQMKISR
eukprot:2418282-Rhodomonas_salina.1